MRLTKFFLASIGAVLFAARAAVVAGLKALAPPSVSPELAFGLPGGGGSGGDSAFGGKDVLLFSGTRTPPLLLPRASRDLGGGRSSLAALGDGSSAGQRPIRHARGRVVDRA